MAAETPLHPLLAKRWSPRTWAAHQRASETEVRLVARDPGAAERIEVRIQPGAGHRDVDDRFYDHALSWLTGA